MHVLTNHRFITFLFSSLLLSASPSFHEAISLFHTIPSIRTAFSPLHLSNTLLPLSLVCRLLFLPHHSSQLLHQPFPHEKPRPSTLAVLPPLAGLGCSRHWFSTTKYMTYRLALFCTLNFLAQTSLMDDDVRSCACIIKHSLHVGNAISGSVYCRHSQAALHIPLQDFLYRGVMLVLDYGDDDD